MHPAPAGAAHRSARGVGLPSCSFSLSPRQVEAISDSDTESRSQREFHSIGVQVEEDKRYRGARPCRAPSTVPNPAKLSWLWLSPVTKLCDFFFFPGYKALCPPGSCLQHLLPLSSQLMPPGLSTIPIPGRISPSHSHPIAAKRQPGEGALLLPQWDGGSFAGVQPWAWNPAQAQVKPLRFSAKKNVIFCPGWECCEPHSL